MELWRKFAGDHITKIVLETTDYGEMASLLQLNNLYAPLALCFAMGEAGAFTRILSVFRGAPWIYASLPGRSTAAGQFTLEELTHLYRIRRFEAEPAVFGILGDPVAHSKSPDFHNGKFSENSLPWIYLPFPCKDLASLLRHSLEFGLTGLSVTHPYKEEVLKYVENVSAVARRLRSCNTLCYKDRRWHGTNTDVEGISEMLEKLHIPVNDARILILGAGASARAIASVVRSQARELVVLNRTRWKAADLAAEFQGRSGGLEEFSQFDYDILFHATPLGLHENECPVNPELLKKGVTVIDAIYEPRDTLLLKKARQLGCRTMNGEEWFYAQAEAQFQWWRKMLA